MFLKMLYKFTMMSITSVPWPQACESLKLLPHFLVKTPTDQSVRLNDQKALYRSYRKSKSKCVWISLWVQTDQYSRSGSCRSSLRHCQEKAGCRNTLTCERSHRETNIYFEGTGVVGGSGAIVHQSTELRAWHKSLREWKERSRYSKKNTWKSFWNNNKKKKPKSMRVTQLECERRFCGQMRSRKRYLAKTHTPPIPIVKHAGGCIML